jgi:hypothetical protein
MDVVTSGGISGGGVTLPPFLGRKKPPVLFANLSPVRASARTTVALGVGSAAF